MGNFQVQVENMKSRRYINNELNQLKRMRIR